MKVRNNPSFFLPLGRGGAELAPFDGGWRASVFSCSGFGGEDANRRSASPFLFLCHGPSHRLKDPTIDPFLPPSLHPRDFCLSTPCSLLWPSANAILQSAADVPHVQSCIIASAGMAPLAQAVTVSLKDLQNGMKRLCAYSAMPALSTCTIILPALYKSAAPTAGSRV